ncbi:MAG: AAA family ATPase [Symbiobacteriia bacterium]
MNPAHHHSPGDETIGSALRDLEDRFFVGRQEECRFFAGCLAGDGDRGEWQILNIHGFGGVGKSSLLDAFRRMAENAGALYLYLDARDLSTSPDRLVDKLTQAMGLAGGKDQPTAGDCLRAIHEAAARRPVVLAFDTYEEIGALDRWLREAFLARLPQRAVVIIAGRYPLRGLWRESPAWRQLVRPMPLAPFDLALTRRYLALHGVPDEALVRAAWDFTGGNPLALSLAAALVGQEGTAALPQAPDRPEVITELARRWLQEVPDERLRALVETAATVRRFDQGLLAHLTGNSVSSGDFDRLITLSFVRHGRGAWALHDLVRSAISRELLWRSPDFLRTIRQRALGHYARLSTLPGSESERTAALEEFFYLLGDSLVRAAFFDADDLSAMGLHVQPATPADLPALQAYMDQWRHDAARTASTDVKLVDRESRAHFRHVLPVEHNQREPEMIDIPAILGLAPGVVHMLKDADAHLRGISIVIPVNARTLGYLEAQPVTGH